ncbi:hypothetical protein C7Y47_19155 [Lysinibacillus sphaericus]|uniref:YvlB/LiaX N-terminal domain-containing protein n=1 Tax=Lysinibacillus sphaericus TaxID=1421 RepID=A0A544UA28_LYSSH|nr:hypothetical protein [Lysinibacillus sp. SDF0037]TQR29009.1 hypothetical protein C7Y47_19155 [Lysinibacillus sp. SDF0037]
MINLALAQRKVSTSKKLFSYPTVRTKLDTLIKKIELNSNTEDLEFVNMIKNLVIDERLSLETAKMIIDKYKSERNDE